MVWSARSLAFRLREARVMRGDGEAGREALVDSLRSDKEMERTRGEGLVLDGTGRGIRDCPSGRVDDEVEVGVWEKLGVAS